TNLPSIRPRQKNAWVSPVVNSSMTSSCSKASITLAYSSLTVSRPSNGVDVTAEYTTTSAASHSTSAAWSRAASAAENGWVGAAAWLCWAVVMARPPETCLVEMQDPSDYD